MGIGQPISVIPIMVQIYEPEPFCQEFLAKLSETQQIGFFHPTLKKFIEQRERMIKEKAGPEIPSGKKG